MRQNLLRKKSGWMLLIVPMMVFQMTTSYGQNADTASDAMNSNNVNSSTSEFKTPKDDKKEVQTLFKNGGLKGVYISGTMKPATLNGQAGILLGGEGALVFGHKMNDGISGYGLATDIRSNATTLSGQPLYYELGYGGVFFEPVFGSHKMVHLTMPITLGGGWVSLNERRWDYDYAYNDYGDSYDFFLIAETGLNVELNVFKVLRVDAGASYRFVNDVNLNSTGNSDLKGFNANITMKLGFF